MKITIESTTRIVKVNGTDCRVWEGKTADGVEVVCLIPRIAAKEGQGLSQFESDLKQCTAPTLDAITAFPLRMVL